MEENLIPFEVSNKLFETYDCIVYHNGCGEIFIKLKYADIHMRITPRTNKIEVTAARNKISPWSINGLPAFVVY